MKLYITDVAALEDVTTYNMVYNLLPDFRKKKVDKYKANMSKYLSVGAGILLKYAFENEGKGDLINKIYEDELGKPLVEGEICFNLSHSGERAICVISNARVGADIQITDRDNTDIAKRFFTEGENDYIFAKQDETIIKNRFFEVWTKKEAYTKMTGEGMRRDFTKTDVLKDYGSFWCKSFDNYFISVCSDEDIEGVEVINIDLSTIAKMESDY